MKSKITETRASIPIFKKVVPKADSIRLELIENNLQWLIICGCIGFSLAVWGYNDLKSEMKELRSEMKDLRAEMNSKFEQVDRKIEKQTAMLLKAIKRR